MNPYTAAVFDLDGTLLNTLDDLTDSLNFVLRKNGLPGRTADEVRQSVGNGVGRLIEQTVPGGRGNPLFEICVRAFQIHYAKNCKNKTKPYSGIEQLLRGLYDVGVRMAVVSNKPDKAVGTLVGEWFSPYIDVAAGESPKIPRKPDPAAVFGVMKELGVCPENTVYIGDSEVDIETAQNTGIKFIGVTWGFRSRETLLRNGAETLIDRPDELLEILFQTER